MPNTILVADDNQMNLNLMKMILEREDYTVILARDGEEAIELAKEKLPELIFMDIQMPKTNGLTAIKILKEYDGTKAIPIIAITAHSLTEDIKKIEGSGCDKYILRPIKPDEIIKLVHDFMK